MTKHVQHHLFELLPIYALAVEHAATLAGHELDFQKLFITQEEETRSWHHSPTCSRSW